jgi:hypothetical protein
MKNAKANRVIEAACYECGEPFKKGQPYYVVAERVDGSALALCELCNEEMEERS